jgi:hypothetical protein
MGGKWYEVFEHFQS